MNTKKGNIDPDNPPLTAAELRAMRPVSAKRRAMFKKAYVNTFGKEPPIMGRPPKAPNEKYRDVHIRLHPQAFAWAKAQAKKLGVGYQTVINDALLHRTA